MSLLFGMPPGISDDLESALAAVQTWAGKQDGNGKWIDAVKDASSVSGFLRIDGAGNSWTVTASANPTAQIAYALIGNTMTLGFVLIGTTLTIGAGETGVYLLIPDGYYAINRFTVNAGHMVNGATGLATRILANPAATIRRYLRIERISGVLADDSGGAFTVEGQITFEVARS